MEEIKIQFHNVILKQHIGIILTQHIQKLNVTLAGIAFKLYSSSTCSVGGLLKWPLWELINWGYKMTSISFVKKWSWLLNDLGLPSRIMWTWSDRLVITHKEVASSLGTAEMRQQPHLVQQCIDAEKTSLPKRVITVWIN